MPFDIVVLRRGKQETIQNVRLAEASSPQGYRTAVRLRQLAGAKDAEIMITVTRKGNRITLIRNEGPLMITRSAPGAPKIGGDPSTDAACVDGPSPCGPSPLGPPMAGPSMAGPSIGELISPPAPPGDPRAPARGRPAGALRHG